MGGQLAIGCTELLQARPEANRELWLRARRQPAWAVSCLGQAQVEWVKVDFHLLLLTGTLASGGFLPARLPPAGRGRGAEAWATVGPGEDAADSRPPPAQSASTQRRPSGEEEWPGKGGGCQRS